MLERIKKSDLVGFYRKVCAKYGEAPADFQRERRAAQLMCELYQRRNPSKLGEVMKLLGKCKGSRETFYRRACEKYGEAPADLSAKPAVKEEPRATGGAAALVRTPSPSSYGERSTCEEEPVGRPELFRRGSMKECTKCGASYKGYGDVCGACRKLGPRGSLLQCPGCGAYYS